MTLTLKELGTVVVSKVEEHKGQFYIRDSEALERLSDALCADVGFAVLVYDNAHNVWGLVVYVEIPEDVERIGSDTVLFIVDSIEGKAEFGLDVHERACRSDV